MLRQLKDFLSRKPHVASDEDSTDTDDDASDEDDADLIESDPPWLGVALDGTLADDSKAEGDAIGPPVHNMVQRLIDWDAQGYCIKILTWRAATEAGLAEVHSWLKQHGLPSLEVTDAKDFSMVEFWSADALQVPANTGEPVGESKVPPAEAKVPTAET